MDRCGTVDMGRQARKSARRDAVASGKRFDVACRPICAALRVTPGGAARGVEDLDRSSGYAPRPSPGGPDSAWRDDALVPGEKAGLG